MRISSTMLSCKCFFICVHTLGMGTFQPCFLIVRFLLTTLKPLLAILFLYLLTWFQAIVPPPWSITSSAPASAKGPRHPFSPRSAELLPPRELCLCWGCISGCVGSLLHLATWKVGMGMLWTSPRGFRTESGIYQRNRKYLRREELSVWETTSWVTESWHSFYLFIKFVTVEISLRSCRPITVSFIVLLRHTRRHSWRLNPIVLCNKPIIDYAMEL